MSSQNPPTALVTGVSSGIGRATAQALKAEGYRVFGTSRQAATGDEVEGIELVRLDVGDEQSVLQAVDVVLAKTGRIDLLVNNAGYGVMGAAEESSIEQAEAIFDTNLFGVIRMIKAVLPTMRTQKSGRIINMSSVLGLIPSPYMALYSASKHALEGYSESLDHEVRGQGIRVILVEPAYTKTSFEENIVVADTPLLYYREANRSIKDLLTGVMATADAPKIVADVVVKAAASVKPRLRYTAGAKARSVSRLRRFVPQAFFDKAFRAEMKLDA